MCTHEAVSEDKRKIGAMVVKVYLGMDQPRPNSSKTMVVVRFSDMRRGGIPLKKVTIIYTMVECGDVTRRQAMAEMACVLGTPSQVFSYLLKGVVTASGKMQALPW